MDDKPTLNGHANIPDKGSKFEKKEIKRLPKVDEELHARTIFEPVSVEARPAKTKPKIRSKLKWKEDVDTKEKTEESKSTKTEESKNSTTSSDKAIRLNMKKKKKKKESDQIKMMIASEKSGKSTNSTDEIQQSILWIIIRKIFEEILIWLIIIIILITITIRNSLNF